MFGGDLQLWTSIKSAYSCNSYDTSISSRVGFSVFLWCFICFMLDVTSYILSGPICPQSSFSMADRGHALWRCRRMHVELPQQVLCVKSRVSNSCSSTKRGH